MAILPAPARIGTIQYMAPERLKNEPFDRRSAIFSAGVLMFQLLTGQLPFAADQGGDHSIALDNSWPTNIHP